MRKIVNSTYITLDGVIQDPQDWPGNGIEPDGTGTKVQMDSLLFRPAATAQLELAGTLALNSGTVILTYRVPSATPSTESE
jgi:hypothetical protein